MSGFRCTADGDIDVAGGMSIVTGAQEVRQNVAQRLRTFLGEWFLDTTLGVPYMQEIFTKGPDLELVEGMLKREILGTAGVDQLLSFSMAVDAATRQMTVTFEAETVDGVIEGEVAL